MYYYVLVTGKFQKVLGRSVWWYIKLSRQLCWYWHPTWAPVQDPAAPFPSHLLIIICLENKGRGCECLGTCSLTGDQEECRFLASAWHIPGHWTTYGMTLWMKTFCLRVCLCLSLPHNLSLSLFLSAPLFHTLPFKFKNEYFLKTKFQKPLIYYS